MHLPRVTASAIDRDAPSAAIDAGVRALASAGAPVFTLDASLVASLAPQVLLTQSVCEVCALPESEVERAVAALAVAPAVVSLGGTTLEGVWDDVRRVGDAIGRRAEADALIASSAARMRRVHETLKAARAPRPRVAVIEWIDPLFVAGHWSPELVRRAGGIDVLAEPGAHSVQIDVDAVRAADPEVLLFAPCGFDVDRAAREAGTLLETERVAVGPRPHGVGARRERAHQPTGAEAGGCDRGDGCDLCAGFVRGAGGELCAEARLPLKYLVRRT